MNDKALGKMADLLDDMATHNIKLSEHMKQPSEFTDGQLLKELKKHSEDYYKKLRNIYNELVDFKDN